MRLSELIKPNYFEENIKRISSDDFEMDAEKLVKYLKRNAQPWLDATHWGKLTFYRGVKSKDKPLFYTTTIRQDRRPKDTSPELHQIYNKIISLAGGVANRSNSAFVTSSKSIAQSYGTPYVFMALGPFHSTYHLDWRDWTMSATTDKLKKLLKDPSTFITFRDKPNWVSNRAKEMIQNLENELDRLQDKSKEEIDNNHELKQRIAEIEHLISPKGEVDLRNLAFREFQKLQDSNLRILLNPNSYDIDEVKKRMVIDGDLTASVAEPASLDVSGGYIAPTQNVEVMVHAKSAVLINPKFYEDYVLHYLKKLK